MAKDNKKYTIDDDSQSMMVGEPAAVYASRAEQNHIVLTVPEGIDAEPLREKVNAYYKTLLHESLLEQKFNYHYNRWIFETGPLSNPYAIADNEHFKEIVKMGKVVAPYIVDKMKTDNPLIYLALEQIYHERLIKPQPLEGNPMMYSWNHRENIRLWIERLS